MRLSRRSFFGAIAAAGAAIPAMPLLGSAKPRPKRGPVLPPTLPLETEDIDARQWLNEVLAAMRQHGLIDRGG